MKQSLVIVFSLFCLFSYGQKFQKFVLGKGTEEEVKMPFYKNDSTVNAVILEEKGFVRAMYNRPHKFIKHYYVRIKIFKKSALDLGTIEIPFYSGNKLENIKAITYNLADGELKKEEMSEDAVLKNQYTKGVNVYSFPLPNVREGSVIEYRYSLKTNNHYIFNWNFQDDYPKLTSNYKADLPKNVKFNIRMIGALKPQIDSAFVKRKCNSIRNCLSLHFEMNNIPAFIEEAYISNKSNYMSKLSVQKDYAFMYKKKKESNWEYLDRKLKEYFERSLDVTSFYKKMLPDDILNEQNPLVKAQKVYGFIKDAFIKNNKVDYDLKEAFKKGVATEDQINTSLYYALKAASLNPNIVFISSRSNGKVIKLFATLGGFDDLLVRLNLNNKVYHLDASNKKNSFGLVSFDYLNGEGRVLDYDKGSFWETIQPTGKSSSNTKIDLSFNEDGDVMGSIYSVKKGYHAYNRRKKIDLLDTSKIIELFETQNPDIEVEEYKNENNNDLEKPLKENYSILIENDEELGDVISVNPFVINRMGKNPFTLKTREYPVDYGYRREYSSFITFKIPNGYQIKALPKNLSQKLPNKGGSFIFNVTKKNNEVVVYFKYKINKEVFLKDEYPYLKAFYNQLIKVQKSTIDFIKL